MPNPSTVEMNSIGPAKYALGEIAHRNYYYLSGPMTNYPNYNEKAFVTATTNLRADGWNIVSPSEMDAPEELEKLAAESKYGDTYFNLLRRDIEVIIDPQCTGVIVLKDWEQSKGAREEVRVARAFGKEVLRYPELTPVVDKTDSQPENILEEADRLVGGKRGESYGHPYHDFSRTAQIMTGILGHKVETYQVPLLMIAVKLSRQMNSRKRDNLTDIAGYARTAEMVDEFEKMLQEEQD